MCLNIMYINFSFLFPSPSKQI
uniref:Uncharacterized protein n=1 Tax=Anguilla anguilla TaxID=7936 RepID=A0A0E9VGP2_ANGAN